jgi:hypothetical protein
MNSATASRHGSRDRHDCHWVSAEGPYALGHIITVGDAITLTPAGRQAVTTGGTEASVAGAAALKAEVMTSESTMWTSWPLLAMRQFDQALYGLTSPSPSEAASLDYANDMTNYAVRYGVRSGRGGEAVFRMWSTRPGGILRTHSCGTPIYSYVDDYAIHCVGNRADPGDWVCRPHVDGHDQRVALRSRCALSDHRLLAWIVGRSHRGRVSWGEGQPAVAGRWSRDVRNGWRLRLGGDFWRQRAAAAPGPLDNGGAMTGGLSKSIGHFVVVGDLGYKTTGVMLGQPHDNGWFWSIGSAIKIGR